MAPFDRPYATIYWSAIVNIALSCTVYELFWRWIISWPWNRGWRSLSSVSLSANCGICTEPHWLLQRCTRCNTTVNHRAVKACAERSCPTCFGLRSHDHITPALAQLHWLPVQFRIKFKLCLLMHQIHVGRLSAYLAELTTSSAENCRRPDLRSTDCVHKSLNVPSLSLDLQNGTVCQVTKYSRSDWHYNF